ncbi:septum formation initiator family protein [Georgenia sp. TF02-10]|uniref:FtsB family cell division protein n=1 Tax=Georgenia sp. TF02-10 TaxID=2917725 RepID=UPI001FA781C4|nr:septum formation initiator family protein [Georgenia sp. TF02-10]UNX55602.1 septum formation initiator family protein [Georgenia sp. TF02-10]
MSTRRPAAPRGAAGARGANRGRGAAERPAPPRAKAAPRPTASAGATAARPAGRQAPRRGVTLGAPRADGRPRPTISLRALGLLIVALVAFTVLAPTLRYAVAQQEQLRTLNAQVSDARERTAALEHELERWQDPAYVQAQARDRLGYVMPGETPYVVVDPETVTGGESPAEAEAAERAAARAAATPWYVRVWDSVQVAGESATGEEDPSGLTTPTEDALTPTGAPTGPPPETP